MAFIDVFGELGLRHPDSTAIDVAKVAASVTGSAGPILGTAVAGVISAAVALTDPAKSSSAAPGALTRSSSKLSVPPASVSPVRSPAAPPW